MTNSVAAKQWQFNSWTDGTKRSYPQGANDLILNIGSVNYFDTQEMFLNVLKQTGANVPYSAWSTQTSAGTDTNEEVYLEQILDANGYPTTLTLTIPPSGGQVFTQLFTGAFINIGTGPGVTNLYPADTYRFQWQGKGTITFAGDVKVLANASAGCTIAGLSVTSTNAWGTVNSVTLQGTGGTALSPTTAGIRFIIPAGGITDSANYPKAMTCVQSTYAALFDGGQIFHPNLLAWLQQVPWRALRFMDTLQTNNQLSHAHFTAYNFSSAPTAGSPLPALAGAWTNPSGQRRITLATGEELLATFTTGSTTVTSTVNPTVTASSTTVPSGESTTDFSWFAYDSWAGRPQLGDMTYATNRGVPFEICIDLCKKVGCDVWLNVPPQFQAADWASFASMVTSNLGTNQKAIIEYINETWNGAFYAFHYLLCKSEFLWGASDAGSMIGRNTALLADQLATTAGNPGFDNSFIVLMAGQAANTAWLTSELKAVSWTGNTPPWQRTSASGQKTIKGVCIAPYIGQGPIYAADFTLLQSQVDGGYTDFLAQLTQNPVPSGNSYHDQAGNVLPAGGWCQIAAGWVTNNITAIAPYGAPPVYCYEGSWQFYHASESPSQATFLSTAARDSRMAAIQQSYYRKMAEAGATPCQYNFCGPYGNFQWGLIESSMQVETPLASTPARWQGAVNYVNNG